MSDLSPEHLIDTLTARPDCNWTRCVRAKRTDGKCFHWCKCRCHSRVLPPEGGTDG